jgi:hypothetical protein
MTYKVPPNGVKVWHTQPFFLKKKQRGVEKNGRTMAGY